MKDYRWMTRAECKNFAREMLIAGVLFGCFAIAVQFQPLGVVWLGRAVFILFALIALKRKERFFLLSLTPFLVATFISETFAMMLAFLCFVFGGLGVIGYAFLTPLNYLLKNFMLWRDM